MAAGRLTSPTNQQSETHQLFLGPQHDFWKRPYLYTPPNSTNNTHGLVGTYGADGLPNGNPSDGDMSLIITN